MVAHPKQMTEGRPTAYALHRKYLFLHSKFIDLDHHLQHTHSQQCLLLRYYMYLVFSDTGNDSVLGYIVDHKVRTIILLLWFYLKL
jgi:hypothetical protein